MSEPIGIDQQIVLINNRIDILERLLTERLDLLYENFSSRCDRLAEARRDLEVKLNNEIERLKSRE